MPPPPIAQTHVRPEPSTHWLLRVCLPLAVSLNSGSQVEDFEAVEEAVVAYLMSPQHSQRHTCRQHLPYFG